MYDKERSAVRVVPQRPVTVVIETHDFQPVAFGGVADISEAGACVWTDEAGFAVGDRLILLLSFDQSQSLQAAGRVVWSGPDRFHEGASRYGLQWAATSGPQHARLKTLIRSSQTSH
jgi:Tfp pilus assembly protein PilZ